MASSTFQGGATSASASSGARCQKGKRMSGADLNLARCSFVNTDESEVDGAKSAHQGADTILAAGSASG